MSGKSIAYWRSKFEQFTRVRSDYHIQVAKDGYPEVIDFNAARKLLLEYSATTYHPRSSYGFSGGGWCSLFWAGRWNTHHAKEVQSALFSCSRYNGPFGKDKPTVLDLIIALKKTLAHKKLNPEGDLSRILQVLEEKTGVSFHRMDIVPNKR